MQRGARDEESRAESLLVEILDAGNRLASAQPVEIPRQRVIPVVTQNLFQPGVLHTFKSGSADVLGGDDHLAAVLLQERRTQDG